MALSQEDLLKMYGYGSFGSGIGSIIGNIFGKSPVDAANKYLNKIPGQAGQYLQPYSQYGQQSLPMLQDQYNSLLGSPGGKLNEIGQNYQQSPGFKFALDQALAAGNRSAAAGGMAGSPAAQAQNMATATGLANQDYNDWMHNALGLYGEGLHGQQGMAEHGQQAGQSMADMISAQLAQQANMAYGQQSAKNQNWGNAFSNIIGSLPFIGGIFS